MAIVQIKEVGGGINKDLLSYETRQSIWSDALNARFRSAFAETRGGIAATFITPEVTPYAVAAYSIPGTRYVVRAGLAKVYADDGTTSTNITPASDFTGAIADRWDLSSLNGVFIANNGVDNPMYWNGNTGTDLATLTGWTNGNKATFCKPFSDYLIVGGPTLTGTKYPHNVMWSNAAEPGAIPTAWTAASTNDAGDSPFCSATGGAIVDGLALGDVFVIYKQDARFGMQYIGGNDVFRFFRMDTGNDGLLAKGCVTSTPVGHVYLSPSDVRIHTGGESRSIADGRIRRFIFNNMDTTNASRAFLVNNVEFSEVWVCFPNAGSTTCDRAAVWNWQDDTWTVFTLPSITCGCAGLTPSPSTAAPTWTTVSGTWGSISTVWNEDNFSNNRVRLVLGAAGYLGLAESGSTDFGTAFTWTLEKTGMALGDDDDSVKVIKAIRPQVDGDAGATFSVYVGAAMTVDAAPVYSSAGTYTVGTTNWINKFSRAGRFHGVKLSGTSSIALRSYDVDVTAAGRF